jgi:hypothetical protein
MNAAEIVKLILTLGPMIQSITDLAEKAGAVASSDDKQDIALALETLQAQNDTATARVLAKLSAAT